MAENRGFCVTALNAHKPMFYSRLFVRSSCYLSLLSLVPLLRYTPLTPENVVALEVTPCR